MTNFLSVKTNLYYTSFNSLSIKVYDEEFNDILYKKDNLRLTVF